MEQSYILRVSLSTVITIMCLFLSIDLVAQNSDSSVKHKQRVVMIDAGHGGKDPGTHGSKFVEKDIALEISLKLGNQIAAAYPNTKVLYTRTDDKFVELFKRIRLANEANADLFISIHCNNVKNKKVKGTETFVMGLHRAEENLEVASRENESILMEKDYESNYDGYDPNSPVGHIMLSMYQDAYLKSSIQLASSIEKQLTSNGHRVSRGVKQAGFAVLRRASMPSVLVETGFLSNKEEEQYLASAKGQRNIVQSITNAVGDFFELKAQQVNPSALSSANALPPAKESTIKPKPKQATKVTKTQAQYTIQIAAMKTYIEDLDRDDLDAFGEMSILNVDGLYKYRLGTYGTKSAASSDLSKLRKLGFTGAFVTIR